MNRRLVLYFVGNVIKLEAVLMLPALITALIYREECAVDFLVAIGVSLAVGFLLTFVFRPSSKVFFSAAKSLPILMLFLRRQAALLQRVHQSSQMLRA